MVGKRKSGEIQEATKWAKRSRAVIVKKAKKDLIRNFRSVVSKLGNGLG